MREPFAVTTKWVLAGGDALTSPPPAVQAAYRQIDRQNRASTAHYIDWSSEEIEPLLHLVDQQRLEFDIEDSHANVRLAVARYLETTVTIASADPSIWKLSARLRAARQTGTLMYNPMAKKFITIWDDKAGLPLLCPDDAREEAMRVQRRYVPTLVDWRNNGKAVHKLVLTMPNYAAGSLREGMDTIFKRFRRLVLKSGRFPEIKGALVTLEAPLSEHRDWNVHLNVIVMCDGFLDYGKLRALWHWQVDAYRLRGSQEDVETALRELIKYPVQAMPSKSDGHARNGSRAPALTEWTAAEFIEWWDAHQRFRRTRTYGLLFGLDDPEPESLEGFVSIGFVCHDGTRLVRRLTLLDSIPGDKSSGTGALDRYRRAIERLHGPPDAAREGLQLAEQAIAAWEQIQNQS
jgi:hypothetical protein